MCLFLKKLSFAFVTSDRRIWDASSANMVEFKTFTSHRITTQGKLEDLLMYSILSCKRMHVFDVWTTVIILQFLLSTTRSAWQISALLTVLTITRTLQKFLQKFLTTSLFLGAERYLDKSSKILKRGRGFSVFQRMIYRRNLAQMQVPSGVVLKDEV